MKTRQIVSTFALASALTLGLSGCGLFTPVATLEQYAPSDGVDVNVESVKMRNMMLITDEDAKKFNVVFTGVNNGDAAALVRFAFVNDAGSAEATADFDLEPGINVFGPKGDNPQTIIQLNGPKAGDTVKVFVEVQGLGEAEVEVPVLDGTLDDYSELVP